MSAEIQAWFEDYQRNLRDEGRKLGVDEGRKLGVDEGRKLGVDEGRKLGVDEGERKVLVRQLRVRFGSIPPVIMARIDAASAAHIEIWCERVLFVTSLDEVFGETI